MPSYKLSRAGDGQKDAYHRTAQRVAIENGCANSQELQVRKGLDEARNLIETALLTTATLRVVSPVRNGLTGGLPGNYLSRSGEGVPEFDE